MFISFVTSIFKEVDYVLWRYWRVKEFHQEAWQHAAEEDDDCAKSPETNPGTGRKVGTLRPFMAPPELISQK